MSKFKVGDKVRRSPAHTSGWVHDIDKIVTVAERKRTDPVGSIRFQELSGELDVWDEWRFDLIATIDVAPPTVSRVQKNEAGLKYDADKTRIDLFPGDVLFAISDILTFGAKKYADRNWEKGMSWGRCFGALMRHLWAWWQGKAPTNENFVFGTIDPETKRSHLWHGGCCLAFLIAYEMRGIGTDDRPVPYVKEAA